MNLNLSFLSQDKNKISNFPVLIVAFIIGLFIYNSIAKDITVLNQQKQEEIKKNELSRKIVSLEKDISPYKEFLNKKNMSKIINTINTKAAESQIKIVSFKPLPEVSRLNYTAYPFDLNILADSYSAIGRFISSLESSPEVFIIEDIGINVQRSSGSESKKEKLTVNLRLNTVTAK